MKKSKRVALIVSVGLLFFLFAQFTAYMFLTGKYSVDNKERQVGASNEESLRAFLRIAHLCKIRLLPFDLLTLTFFLSNGMSSSLCSYFCHSNVVKFATFEESTEKKQLFISKLDDASFHHAAYSVYDEEMLAQNVKVNVTLHRLFSKHDLQILVVVLFQRQGNFLWHGKVDHHLMTSNNQSSDLAKKEGAYDIFSVNLVEVDGTKLFLPLDIPDFLLQMADSEFISCNFARARLYYQQYGFDASEEAAQFKTIAWKMLSLVTAALKDLRVSFWLSSGTCLGYFRQCDVFPHGKDVDIGIRIKNYSPLIIPALVASGMRLKHRFGKVEDSLELSFFYASVKLDIFFFYEENNYTWNGGVQAKSGKKFKYIFPKFSLCWTEFLGLKVRIPCQTQQYIEANYGPDWFHPVWMWDWKTSPFNVHSNGQWPKEEWPEVIQQMDIK